MRLSVTLLFASTAFATLVSRQSPPQCALTCIATANTGTCSSTDNKCLCANQAFVSSTTNCIESTCTGSDLQSAIQFAQADCAAVGVTLTESVSGSPTASGFWLRDECKRIVDAVHFWSNCEQRAHPRHRRPWLLCLRVLSACPLSARHSPIPVQP
ncbi:hypothetical protein DFH11DRAFT_384023 [Phellopilus nigrolimitatus]|nr:hypothetical protein DFH11DRAFT_384023 [Phellopilus nigrolimitatus]